MRGQQRHDFRFVVEGVALTPEQREDVAQAVREAGLRALSRHSKMSNTVLIDSASFGRKIDWAGQVVRELAAAQAKEQMAHVDYR